MKKMKTLFNQDEKYKVVNSLREENKFIDSGDFTVYRKRDGTSCFIDSGVLYKRYDANVKRGRKLPNEYIHCQEKPNFNGSFPVWVKVDKNDKYHNEAFIKLDQKENGTYELCGEKVNGNKENIKGHTLIPHDSEVIEMGYLSFEVVKNYLKENEIEGLIIKDNKTGLMTKIRRVDFGFDW